MFAHASSRFARNLRLATISNVVAHGLTLALTPLLTRLYSPADFAAVSALNSAAVILGSVATLRFDWCVPRPRLNGQAICLAQLGCAALLSITLLASLVLLLFPSLIPRSDAYAFFAAHPLLLPLLVVGQGLHHLAHGWFIRGNDLGPGANIRIVQGIVGAAITVIGGYLALGPAGLIAGTLLSSLFGLGMFWHHISAPTRRALSQPRRRRLHGALKRYLGESLAASGVALVNTLGQSCAVFLVALYFTPTELGWFALMQRAALLPLGLFTSSLAQSFWAESARLIRDNPRALQSLYLQCTRKLAWVSLLAIGGCLLAPWLIGPLLGKAQWQGAGEVLAVLTPLVVGQVIVSPLSHLGTHGLQHWQLACDLIRLVAIIATFLAARALGLSFLATLGTYAWVMLAMYAATFALNLAALRRAVKTRHQ
jgi:O-antigen/teichoic acid export membrane protein